MCISMLLLFDYSEAKLRFMNLVKKLTGIQEIAKSVDTYEFVGKTHSPSCLLSPSIHMVVQLDLPI